jgi:hypothetical protein
MKSGLADYRRGKSPVSRERTQKCPLCEEQMLAGQPTDFRVVELDGVRIPKRIHHGCNPDRKADDPKNRQAPRPRKRARDV